MKRYLEFYNDKKTYYFPDMTEATPEIVASTYPIVSSNVTCVIETDKDRNLFYTTPKPLGALATQLGVELKEYFSEEDSLEFLEGKLNEPLPEPEPSAEERIASAMEFQNMML